MELTEDNRKQFYIPEGFALGFLVLSDIAEFCYKCTDFYYPNDEGGLLWSDPDIGFEWPISDMNMVKLSEKDQKKPNFCGTTKAKHGFIGNTNKYITEH